MRDPYGPASARFSSDETATTEIYTLSLHDALPISKGGVAPLSKVRLRIHATIAAVRMPTDRKSTRLNSSHMSISYAVFCLKKKSSWSLSDRRSSPALASAATYALSCRSHGAPPDCA